jgi:hypothetical protein
MSAPENIKAIDEKLIKIQMLINNWETAKVEIGEQNAIKFISKTLASTEYDFLSLLRDLKLPTNDFIARRNQNEA